MAESVIVSRRFTFGPPEKMEDGTMVYRHAVTVPVGVFVDEKAADDAVRDLGSMHSLVNGTIVAGGKPIMTVLQWCMAMGISSFGLVCDKARVREASLLIAGPGSVKLDS